jgi:hypothetical protein
MYVPRVNSRRAKILDIINNSGGITIERLIEKHGMMDFQTILHINHEFKKLIKKGVIKQLGTVYFPVYRDKPAASEPDNLVPPREPIPFKPLKTFPPTVSPRGQPIERRSFKTCKSNVRYKRENDL